MPQITTAAALLAAALKIRATPEIWEPRFGSVSLYEILHAVAPGGPTTRAFASLRTVVFGSPSPAPLSEGLQKMDAAEVAALCEAAAKIA